jgi:hypothetical protein
MKFEKIVAFGDSWVWGDELLDPSLAHRSDAHPVLIENTEYREHHCFLGQLGSHYQVPTQNFGIPGGSLQSTIWTYLWWMQNETVPLDRCAVVVGLTEPYRHTFYNPKHVSYTNDPPWHRFVHTAWIHSGSTCYNNEWTQMAKNHMVLTDCSASHQLNYLQTVMFFEGQSRYQTGPLLQVNTMQSVPDVLSSTLIWPQQSLNQLLHLHPNHSTLFAPQGHPNEKGHQVIQDHLIIEIDRAIIAQ